MRRGLPAAEGDGPGGRAGGLVPDRSAYAPYPELVDPGPAWRVLDSSDRPWLPSIGVTDKGRRVVYTPLRADSHAVSIHELGHVRFSPPRLPRVRFEPLVLHAVEDARVNLALQAAGLRMGFDAERQADLRLRACRDLKEGQLAVFVLRAVASVGTSLLPALRAELEMAPPHAAAWAEGWIRRVEARLEAARRRRGGEAAPFRVGLDLARQLARDLERHGLLRCRLRAPGLACCVEVPEADDAERARRGRRDGLPEGRRGRHAHEERRGLAPGRLRIVEAALPVARRAGGRPLGQRPRPAAEGCTVARPHRWPLDRAIFRRRVRWRGGTVLIDTSGSMHLSPEAVDALVEASRGAAVVATYSGRGCEGELRVVARGGRRAAAEDLETPGSGNVVDLPALEWLACQAEPRLWISDGAVTGVGDRSSPEIRERCSRVVRRARIVRVDSADQAARRLAAGCGSRG